MFRHRHRDTDLDHDIQAHLDLLAAEHQRHGLSPQAAREAARRDFGGVEQMREEYRDRRPFRWFNHLVGDVRFGTRMLARQPGLLLVVVLTMALGIGINTAVFGLMRTLILSPLPVPDPERVVFVMPTDFSVHSIPNYRDLRDRNTTFTQLAAYRPGTIAMDIGDGLRQVWGTLATGNFFETLGIAPVRGRLFTAADEQGGPGSAPVAVLSYAFWNNAFRGADEVIGREIRINGLPFTIIGVAAPGFNGADLFRQDLWVPMVMQREITGVLTLDVREVHNNNRVVGRLRRDVTIEQAQQDASRIAAALAREYPADNARLGFTVGRAGSSADITRGGAVPMVSGIFALAGLVLLAACVAWPASWEGAWPSAYRSWPPVRHSAPAAVA